MYCGAAVIESTPTTSNPFFDNYLTPNGVLDNIFDRFGNHFLLNDITLGTKEIEGRKGIYKVTNALLCTSGIFELYFESGSGMEINGNTDHDARRAVVCRVFQDVSNFINTPLKNTGNLNKVRIHIRNIITIGALSAQILGVASGYYNAPSSPTFVNGGIIDNEVYKTIHAGVDSYTNATASPIATTTGSSNFYHGYLALNFNGPNWNINFNSASTGNQIDLYTVVLHEITHAMGFASLIAANGTSRSGFGNYYSRYDTFLRNSIDTRLIAQTNTNCSIMYDYLYNTETSFLHPGCNQTAGINTGDYVDQSVACENTIVFKGAANTIPVYTPSCYENGSSLSHFEDACSIVVPFSTAPPGEGDNQYYVMSNAVPPSKDKRHPTEEERQALCDLGYSVQHTFDDPSFTNGFDYTPTVTCTGNGVAGINDGLNGVNFTFIANVGANLTIPITGTNGILTNDYAYDTAMNNIPANLRVDCVQDVYKNTTTTSPTGTNTQIVMNANNTITFNSLEPGIHLLRYVPFDTSTQLSGNITYVYVVVRETINECATPNICDLIVNGGFETKVTTTNNPCNWQRAFSLTTPDYFTRNTFDSYDGIPCNFAGIQETTLPTMNNNHYYGIILQSVIGSVNPYHETIRSKLKEPLVSTKSYQLKFDISLAEYLQTKSSKIIQIYFSNNPNLQTGYGELTFTTTTPFNQNMLFETNDFINDIDNWVQITINIPMGVSNNEQYIYIGGLRNVQTQNVNLNITDFCQTPWFGAYPTSSYYYIDNVSLVETHNAQLHLPPTLCTTATIPDLSTRLQNAPTTGVFTCTPNAIQTTGTGANTTYSFVPTSAGTYTITYTYAPNPGCPNIAITDTITVTAACTIPFISQVYVNGNDKYIEIKNKTNTPIPANTYNLALYTTALSLGGAPNATIAVPAIAGNGGTVVFRTSNTTAPAYATTTATVLPTTFNVFDGDNDVLMLTTATGTDLTSTTNNTAYLERVDLAGNTTQWCVGKSLVRSSCATNFPNPAFNIDDWVEFSVLEVSDPLSKTNAVLGRHNFEQLRWFGATPFWNEIINTNSLPDRSREIAMQVNYNTNINGSFEACSLIVESLINVTVAPANYVKVQINVLVNPGGKLDIQNNGSLVMVKDSYTKIGDTVPTSGNDLVVLRSTSPTSNDYGTVDITKTTNGVNFYADDVFWSSPLTNNVVNHIHNNKINVLFPFLATNYDRIYTAHNDLFYPGADGYDDNSNYWERLNFTQRESFMTPGQGYYSYGMWEDYSLLFRGQPNNGILNVPVYKNDSSFSGNGNLVGNPYPSPIDLNKLFEVNQSLILPYAAIWGRANDGTTLNNNGIYEYSEDNFLIYSTTMSLSNWPGNLAFNNNGILSSCQSFYIDVRKFDSNLLPLYPLNNSGESSNQLEHLIFNNYMRSTSPMNTFSRGTNTVNDTKTKLWLNLSDESGTKTAPIGIAYLEKGKDHFDPDEDVKNFVGHHLGFYSKSDKHDLIINALSTFDYKKTVSLGIVNQLENSPKLKITVDKATGELQNHEIYLYDRITSKIVNITREPYTFEPNDKIMDDRFTLLFQNKIETEISDLDQNKVIVFAKDGIVTVNSLTDKRISAVYVADLYTPSIGGVEIGKYENINHKMYQFRADSKYKILNIKVVLEDGTVVNKKVMITP
jgi:hypothetical protein